MDLSILNNRGWTKHLIRVKWAANIFEVLNAEVLGTTEGIRNLSPEGIEIVNNPNYFKWITFFIFGPMRIIVSGFHFSIPFLVLVIMAFGCLSMFFHPIFPFWAFHTFLVANSIACWTVAPFRSSFSFREWMTMFTKCLARLFCNNTNATQNICLLGYKFQMFRIATVRIAANMIKLRVLSRFNASRNRCDEKRIEYAVDSFAAATIPNHSITLTIKRAIPYPTTILALINSFENALVLFWRQINYKIFIHRYYYTANMWGVKWN